MARVRGTSIAGVAATLSVVGAVARRWRRVTTHTFDLEVDAETAAVRERLRDAQSRSRHQAIGNTLTAVEGAILLLERNTLTPIDRDSLQRMLGSGIDRMRHLVSDDERPESGWICLADVATKLSEDPAWCQRLQVDVDANLVASASHRQTTEAVRQLLNYVSQRAPVSPITVRGERAAESSVLWVEVRAPGISRWYRRGVFDRQRRSSRAIDMQLHLASRLVRGQGGQLRIDRRDGGGSSFGLFLPTAEARSYPGLVGSGSLSAPQ